MDKQNNLQPSEPIRNSKNIWIVALSVIITAFVVVSSIYAWQKSLLKSTERNFQQQILTLQNEVSDLKLKISTEDNDDNAVPGESVEKLHDEEKLVKSAFINFFNYLGKNDFSNAVKMFHPNEWEGLTVFSKPSERDNKTKVLENYCSSVGMCMMRGEVLSLTRQSDSHYSLVVQFINNDGSIYVFGPCCGATEEDMPSTKQFTYEVKKIDGIYKVITPPLSRP